MENKDPERFPPNNILLMLVGAGPLWLGFNGGDSYNANEIASPALQYRTLNICKATNLLSWLILRFYLLRPIFISLIRLLSSSSFAEGEKNDSLS
ncbi:hypothetical protein MLD38_006026 [Melastoma candidum]|uniref:Uncharacterized protein n=1 Tax=Melastoma candidum TaxID=119954 RepID=A0ACB9RMT6_9MYRT|nr:hypothetical protein MLD38_006026 [Melastoma candidum]